MQSTNQHPITIGNLSEAFLSFLFFLSLRPTMVGRVTRRRTPDDISTRVREGVAYVAAKFEESSETQNPRHTLFLSFRGRNDSPDQDHLWLSRRFSLSTELPCQKDDCHEQAKKFYKKNKGKRKREERKGFFGFLLCGVTLPRRSGRPRPCRAHCGQGLRHRSVGNMLGQKAALDQHAPRPAAEKSTPRMWWGERERERERERWDIV